jgi:hypothetical protein
VVPENCVVAANLAVVRRDESVVVATDRVEVRDDGIRRSTRVLPEKHLLFAAHLSQR